jgi:hypothetical protein
VRVSKRHGYPATPGFGNWELGNWDSLLILSIKLDLDGWLVFDSAGSKSCSLGSEGALAL